MLSVERCINSKFPRNSQLTTRNLSPLSNSFESAKSKKQNPQISTKHVLFFHLLDLSIEGLFFFSFHFGRFTNDHRSFNLFRKSPQRGDRRKFAEKCTKRDIL